MKLNKPTLVQLWPPLDDIHEEKQGKPHGNLCNCQEDTSIAVLQGHVIGEVRI